MSPVTVRLAPQLQAEATGYARDLGISLNSLIAVAVRDYLDIRKRSPGEAALDVGLAKPAAVRPATRAPRPVAAASPKTLAPAAGSPAKVGRNEPCPCGSGRKYKVCHGGAV
jgi:hypothetical protein